jgi:hypothetical protein
LPVMFCCVSNVLFVVSSSAVISVSCYLNSFITSCLIYRLIGEGMLLFLKITLADTQFVVLLDDYFAMNSL